MKNIESRLLTLYKEIKSYYLRSNNALHIRDFTTSIISKYYKYNVLKDIKEEYNNEEFNIFSNLSSLINEVNFSNSQNILDEVNWNKNNDYQSILSSQDELINIGIFNLNKNYSLHIHDHPGMMVISKCLLGSLTIYPFNIINPDKHLRLRQIEAELKEIKILNKEDTSILYPNFNNIHHIEITNKPNNEIAVLLDIFIPHYMENSSYQCNYYSIEERNGSTFSLSRIDLH